MNELVTKNLHNLKSVFVEHGYKCEASIEEESFRLSGHKQAFTFTITYTEEGDRGGYSLYDIDCLVHIKDGSYILILSERGEDNIESDFSKLAVVINGVGSNKFQLVHERKLFFWRRTYLVIDYSGKKTYLLKTHS